MAVLAVRVLLAPCFVVVASLVARRFGVRIGGVVAGLPVIAGPILLVLALAHGSPFASRAAVGVLLGMVGLAAFVLAYVATAGWVAWPGAVAAAYAAFALAVVAMRPVSVGPLVAFLIACGALVLTLGLLPRPRYLARTPLPHPRWDLPFRAVCTAIAVVTVTAIATTLGPHLSGLITSFPIITAVLSAFTHAHRGRDEATRLLRGFTIGFFAYAAFCFVVATSLSSAGNRRLFRACNRRRARRAGSGSGGKSSARRSHATDHSAAERTKRIRLTPDPQPPQDPLRSGLIARSHQSV